MKNVVITGASRGIGLATAKKFLAEDWFVIGMSTHGNIDISNENFISIQVNYLDSESITTAISKIQNLNKKIDVLVNNAGVNVEEVDQPLEVKLLRETLEVNLIGTANFTIQILSFLTNPSHIINISSMAASLTDPIEDTWHLPAYKISKVALNMFTRTMGRQLKPQGVTVSSLDPGWVKTDMGGEEGPRRPEEAAADIYQLAISKVETGKFWLEGKERNW